MNSAEQKNVTPISPGLIVKKIHVIYGIIGLFSAVFVAGAGGVLTIQKMAVSPSGHMADLVNIENKLERIDENTSAKVKVLWNQQNQIRADQRQLRVEVRDALKENNQLIREFIREHSQANGLDIAPGTYPLYGTIPDKTSRSAN